MGEVHPTATHEATVHEAAYVWFVPAILHHEAIHVGDGWGHGGPCLKFTSKFPHPQKKNKKIFWWKQKPYIHVPQLKK